MRRRKREILPEEMNVLETLGSGFLSSEMLEIGKGWEYEALYSFDDHHQTVVIFRMMPNQTAKSLKTLRIPFLTFRCHDLNFEMMAIISK